MSFFGRHDERLSQVPKPSKPQLLDSDTEEEEALPVPAVRKSKAGVGRGGKRPGPALPGGRGKKSKAAEAQELDQEFDRLLEEAPSKGKGKGRGKKTSRPQLQLLDQDSDTEEEAALAPPVRKNKAGGRGRN